eukprot:gene19441-27914_t
MLGGAMEGGLKRKRGSGGAVEPSLPVAPAPKRRVSRAPAKCLNAILFAGDVPFPEGTPGNYADYLNLSAGDMPCPEVSPDDYADYLKEMISGLPFSKIATQDARGSATAPRTTHPLLNDWWYEVVPGNVDQEIPEVSNSSLKPPLDSGSDRKKRRGNKKPPPPPLDSGSDRKKRRGNKKPPPPQLDSGSDRKKRRGNKKPPPPQPGKEKWNRGLAVQWLREKGITSCRQYKQYRSAHGDNVPAEMPSNPVTFYKARDGTLTHNAFWMLVGAPKAKWRAKEKWTQDDAVQWLREKGITSCRQYQQYRSAHGDNVPAEMPSNPVTFYKARDGTVCSAALTILIEWMNEFDVAAVAYAFHYPPLPPFIRLTNNAFWKLVTCMPKECSRCGESKGKAKFTDAQWKKGGTCRVCQREAEVEEAGGAKAAAAAGVTAGGTSSSCKSEIDDGAEADPMAALLSAIALDGKDGKPSLRDEVHAASGGGGASASGGARLHTLLRLKPDGRHVPFAQYNLGVTYADGLAVEVDLAAAAAWYKKAANQGHVKAQCRLGVAHANGE